MKVRFERATYEMTAGQAMQFHFLKWWFPRRRFLRALKRSALRLGPWLVSLLLFSLLGIPILLLLKSNKIANESTMITELAFLFLGSVLLVAAKESVDAERERHSTLIKQHTLYALFHADCNGILSEIAGAVGVKIGQWNTLHTLQNAQCATNRLYTTTYQDVDVDRVLKATSKLRSTLRNTKSTLLGNTFVDCVFTSDTASRFNSAERSLETIDHCASAGNAAGIAHELNPLIWSLFYICVPLRTPWRYANDQARMQMLKRHVERYGIKIR